MLDLEARLDIEPMAWRPIDRDDPQRIVGTVLDRETRDSDYGDPYTVLTIEADDGDVWAYHAFHATSRALIDRTDPQPGDRFAVKYVGQAEPKKAGQSGAHLFRGAIEKASKSNGAGEVPVLPEVPTQTDEVPY